MNDSVCAPSLGDILRELEETMDKANLLALELALRGLEDTASETPFPVNMESIHRFTCCAASATEEIERLVRRVKAA